MPTTTKTATFTVVRTFPRENMMIVRYGPDTYMTTYQEGAKPGHAVTLRVEPK